MSTKLTEHFTLEEFCFSSTAARRGIDNMVPQELLPSAKATCELLERIRSYLSELKGIEVRIDVTSGYRSPAVNMLVGSKGTSEHLQARAADFKAPDFGSAYDVCMALAAVVNKLGIGQLIYEHNSWVHVGLGRPVKLQNRIITINTRGVFPDILES